MKKLLTFILFIFFINCLFAQKDITLKATDFTKNGQAEWFGGDCYQLTSATNWVSGSIWYKKPIDLKKSFEMEVDVFLGCKDFNGADGLVFVFTTQSPSVGFQGEGIGFGGLRPSLGIELDTYQNHNLADPEYDHIGLMVNGNPSHSFDLNPAYAVDEYHSNIEDCKRHRLKVTWTPDRKELQVFFDGKQRVSYQKDIVLSIFENNSEVYWGFTSATGGENNRHQICFEKTIFEKVFEIDEFEDEKRDALLDGDILALENIKFQTEQATILPSSHAELDKLARLLKENPKLSAQIFGHTDNRGEANRNLSLSQKRAEAIGAYLMEKGIAKNRLLARGNGEKFPIADNGTAAGRAKNRRIEVLLLPAIP